MTSLNNNVNDVTHQFKEIVRANGITEKVSEIIVKDAGLQGEGFASKTQYVTVKFENPTVKSLNLFAKVVGESKSHTAMLDEIKAFEKEATFLTKYAPAAEKMWKAKGFQEPLDLYPKCYFGDSRMIVMENLVLDKGYSLQSRAELQDLTTAKVSLQALAKHHAVSYAMIQEEGGPEYFFQRFPYLDVEAITQPQFYDMIGSLFTASLNTSIGMLENNFVEGKEEAISFLKRFQNTSLINRMCNALPCEGDELMVLNHGDYWNNNMLFLKDKETNAIIAHKAIDFQMTRYNTPASDLAYYMFSSVKTDVLISHLKELLAAYLDALKSVSADLGHPISLTYDTLLLQYRKRIDFGFWFGLCIVSSSGNDVLKDFDINKITPDEWAVVYEKLVKKWIAAHPVEAKSTAEELVKRAMEFKAQGL